MIVINLDKLKTLENEQARVDRANAFAKEYDPLVGKYSRGEATQQELIEKAADIRARFPYQE